LPGRYGVTQETPVRAGADEADVQPEGDACAAVDFANLPALQYDRSFWSITATQFLGAFNDNVYKQMLLLLSVNVALQQTATGAPAQGRDMQWIAMLVFGVPFLLFSGIAGLISERCSKRTIIVLSKVAEVVVMTLAMLAFMTVARNGLHPVLLVILFLMGAQSAFFGPGKYGILPEKLRDQDLPKANGVILMTTFLAIIFGTVLAGGLLDAFPHDLWVGASVCVLIAVAGVITSLGIRRVPPAAPNLPFQMSSLAIPPEVRRLFKRDRPLVQALLASCMFWLVGAIVFPAANALGVNQYHKSAGEASLLAGGVGVGIAVGSIAAGWLSRGHVNFHVMRVGAWGIFVCLVLLAVPGPTAPQLLGFWGSLAALILMGISTGLFAVPLQVFLQSRPPAGLKGCTIAAMNQANWLAIIIAALLYGAFDQAILMLGWPKSGMFAFTALLMFPIAFLYRPREETLAPAAEVERR